MEITMKNQILSFVNENNFLCDNQSGFKNNHSTTTTLIKVVNDITESVDKGNLSILVLIDFSKAFNSINFSLLLNKLKERFNFSSSAITLINSYLSDRFQKVVVDENESSYLRCITGVPQGSILGPLLFTLFIEDLSDILKDVGFHLYADDLQIYDHDLPTNINGCVNRMNVVLNRVVQWANKNYLQINSEKTQAIVISGRYRLSVSDISPIILNGTTIPYRDVVKNLGVFFDTRLNWKTHVNATCSGAYGVLSRLWCVAKHLPTETRKRLVIALILPRLIYCAPVYAGMQGYVWDKLKRTLNACARFVYRKGKYEHISEFTIKLLNCDPVNYFNFILCTFIHKVIVSKEPMYLFKELSFTKSTRIKALNIPPNKLEIRSRSFFVHGIKQYNLLNNETKKIIRLSAFREKCFQELSSK
jgi:hypothetical protein